LFGWLAPGSYAWNAVDND